MAAPRVSLQQHHVPVSDRAFLYGDGVFETLLCMDGRPLWPELHLDRLMRGAERLAIDAARLSIAAALVEAAAGTRGPAALRLTLSRGGERRGYCPEPDAGSHITVNLTALSDDPMQPRAPARIGRAAITLAEQPLLAGIKHCNRLEQVLGAAEAARRGLDDVLMCTADGYLQCSSNANVFVLRGKQLLTPACTRAGVAGTRRRLIMQTLAPAVGLEVRECSIASASLADTDALLLSNSLIGVRSVAILDGVELPLAPLAAQLQSAYFEAALACTVSS